MGKSRESGRHSRPYGGQLIGPAGVREDDCVVGKSLKSGRHSRPYGGQLIGPAGVREDDCVVGKSLNSGRHSRPYGGCHRESSYSCNFTFHAWMRFFELTIKAGAPSSVAVAMPVSSSP